MIGQCALSSQIRLQNMSESSPPSPFPVLLPPLLATVVSQVSYRKLLLCLSPNSLSVWVNSHLTLASTQSFSMPFYCTKNKSKLFTCHWYCWSQSHLTYSLTSLTVYVQLSGQRRLYHWEPSPWCPFHQACFPPITASKSLSNWNLFKKPLWLLCLMQSIFLLASPSACHSLLRNT